MRKYFYLSFLALAPGLLPAQKSGDPGFCDTMLKKAKAALNINDYTRARDYCEAALPLCPGLAADFGVVQEAVNKGIENEKRRARNGEKYAKELLAESQMASENFVRKFLKSARADMAARRFNDALEKTKTAAELGVLKPEVAQTYLDNADSSLLHLSHRTALESIRGAAGLGILTPEVLGRAYWANVHPSILHLEYDVALEFLQAIAALGVLKQEAANALLEIAFWYGEAGNAERAAGLLDTVAQVAGKKIDTRQPHRKVIEALDADAYNKLMERYYPVMLVKVEGGAFEMGSDTSRESGEYLHQQEVSSFQMAQYETTWWQYGLFCKATGRDSESPNWGKDGDNPVVNASWFDAIFYLNWVNTQFGLDTFYIVDMESKREGNWGDYYDVSPNPEAKKGYRLPTEAEWEYAAGGGSQKRTRYAGTDDDEQLEDYAWYNENSEGRTRRVGTRKANTLGLHDMSGNVWEWCWDWYGNYPENPDKDYAGPKEEGSNRVVRGGSWISLPEYCRVARRGGSHPDDRLNAFGFRLVFVP